MTVSPTPFINFITILRFFEARKKFATLLFLIDVLPKNFELVILKLSSRLMKFLGLHCLVLAFIYVKFEQAFCIRAFPSWFTSTIMCGFGKDSPIVCKGNAIRSATVVLVSNLASQPSKPSRKFIILAEVGKCRSLEIHLLRCQRAAVKGDIAADEVLLEELLCLTVPPFHLLILLRHCCCFFLAGTGVGP